MGTAITGLLKVPHFPGELYQAEPQAGSQAGEAARNSKGRIPTSSLIQLETALGLRGSLWRPFSHSVFGNLMQARSEGGILMSVSVKSEGISS